MASALSHAFSVLAVAAPLYQKKVPTRIWLAGIVCAALPDLDVIGFRFGVHYGDFWGHRGFTHSLIFAALVSLCLVELWCKRAENGMRPAGLFVFLFLATASHGMLDAMTNGGLGVAFFSPFNNARYFFSWRPILVSPIGVSRFLSGRGLAVLESELV